jgi:hypothetical protein
MYLYDTGESSRNPLIVTSSLHEWNGKLKTHNWEFLVKTRASADASAGLEALVSTRLASG